MCYHDASLVVVRDHIFGKLSDLVDAESLIGEELNPDRTAVGAGVGVGVGCCHGRCVFADHVLAGTRRELKLGAAVVELLVPWFLCDVASIAGLT